MANPRVPDPHVEVLLSLDESEIKELSQEYRDNPMNPFASSLLDNGVRILGIMKAYPIRFMSPLGLWRDNGTFIVIIEFDTCIEVGVFTKNPEIKDTFKDSVFTALNFTRRINYESVRRPIVFKEFHAGMHSVIMRAIRGIPMQVERDEQFYVYKMNKAVALQLEITVPEDLEIRTLDDIHSFTIQGHWPHYYPTTPDYPRSLIDLNGGYGLFRKSNDQLLSWGVKTMMGQMGYIQTVQDFQRKGYASIIVKTLAKEFAREDHYPVAIVGAKDTSSQNFFGKLGFANVGRCHNIHLKLKKNIETPDPGQGSSKGKTSRGRSRSRSRSKSRPRFP